MARPIKEGVDYWPFDVDLLQDRKFRLIRSEFGIKGAYIAIELINLVYREHGYYANFGEEDCLLMSEGVGGGCKPDFIMEVVQGCCRRSLFDAGVYDAFGVLTSRGIQRRYLKIVSKNRADVRLIKDYWLLNLDDDRDVPEAIKAKIALSDRFPTENPSAKKVSHSGNSNKSADNPQIKEKERKENKSKGKEKDDVQAAEVSAPAPAFQLPLNDGSFFDVSAQDVANWASLYPAVDVEQELRKMIGWSESNPTKRKTRRGVAAFIARWLSKEQDKGGSSRGIVSKSDTGSNPYEMYGGTFV